MERELKESANGAGWDFGRFHNGVGLASGLPGFAYSDDDFWRHENDSLFSASWVFAGFVHELSRPGDVVPVTVAGRPLLLVRDKQGTIRAFHNVCRHRCLKLVDKPGNAGAMIRCPYHSWSYSFDGKLRSTPYFGGPENRPPDGFAPENHGLRAGARRDLARLDLRQPGRHRRPSWPTTSRRSSAAWKVSISPSWCRSRRSISARSRPTGSS